MNERFDELMKRDGTTQGDRERASLFWILANNDDLYKKSRYIYDFEDRSIRPECLEGEIDLCSSSRRLVKLGYNLFNGFPADVMDSLCVLDEDNFAVAIEAMKIRFNKL